MVGGSTTGEIHFGRHSDAKPPLRWVCNAGAWHALWQQQRRAAQPGAEAEGGAALGKPMPAVPPQRGRAAALCPLKSPLPARAHAFRFEAGTPAIAEAIGLGAACDYLMQARLSYAVCGSAAGAAGQLGKGRPAARPLLPPPATAPAAGSSDGNASHCLARTSTCPPPPRSWAWALCTSTKRVWPASCMKSCRGCLVSASWGRAPTCRRQAAAAAASLRHLHGTPAGAHPGAWLAVEPQAA